MKLRLTILTIIVFIWANIDCAGSIFTFDTIDSLLRTFSPKSKDRFHLMLLKGKEMKLVNPLEALCTYQEIIQQSSDNDKFIRGLAWEEIGNVYFYLGFSDSAYSAYKKAFEYYLHERCYPCLASLALEVANYKKRIADYQSALQLCYLAIQIGQQSKQLKIIGKAYSIIGMIYNQQRNYHEALKYLQKAINFFQGESFIYERVKTFINIAVNYKYLGRDEDALEIYHKTLETAQKYNFLREKAIILNNMADIYLEKGKIDEAINLLETAINVEKYDAESSCTFYMNLGIAYLKKNQLYLAEKNLLKCYQMLNHLKNVDLLAETFALLSDLYALKQDFQKAYQYKCRHKQIEDSIRSEQSSQILKATEEKFKIKELENENKLLRQQQLIDQMKSSAQEKNFMLLAVLLFLALLALGFLIFLNRMQRRHETDLSKYNKELLEKNSLLAKQKQEIAESILARDKLFSIISHDLRNPVASLISFARIIRRDFQKLTPDELNVLVSEMEKVVNRMSDLLENLLLWYQTQSDKWIAQPDVILLQRVVQKVIDYYEKSLQLKSLSIETKLDNESAMVYADEKMVETILRNLVSNAIKYTPERGKITIIVEKMNQEYVIKVQDTGIGMGNEKIASIMSDQLVKSSPGTAGEKGSGLGLSIVKELIEKNNGRFWIESTPGKGTTFYFTLPASEPST